MTPNQAIKKIRSLLEKHDAGCPGWSAARGYMGDTLAEIKNVVDATEDDRPSTIPAPPSEQLTEPMGSDIPSHTLIAEVSATCPECCEEVELDELVYSEAYGGRLCTECAEHHENDASNNLQLADEVERSGVFDWSQAEVAHIEPSEPRHYTGFKDPGPQSKEMTWVNPIVPLHPPPELHHVEEPEE